MRTHNPVEPMHIPPRQAKEIARCLFTKAFDDSRRWFDLAWDACSSTPVNSIEDDDPQPFFGLEASGTDPSANAMISQFALLFEAFMIAFPATREQLALRCLAVCQAYGRPPEYASRLVTEMELASTQTSRPMDETVAKGLPTTDQIEATRQRLGRFKYPFIETIVTQSPTMLELFERLERFVELGVDTLILGETGVGKELVAAMFAQFGKRAGRRVVALNCASIAAGVAESELFGSCLGGFSGAREKLSPFEEAEGGVLFFDEFGDLEPNNQAKLLRALASRTISRVGGRCHKPTDGCKQGSADHGRIGFDATILAATNRDLGQNIRSGTFMQELYHRMSAFILTIPALRATGGYRTFDHPFSGRGAQGIWGGPETM